MVHICVCQSRGAYAEPHARTHAEPLVYCSDAQAANTLEWKAGPLERRVFPQDHHTRWSLPFGFLTRLLVVPDGYPCS